MEDFETLEEYSSRIVEEIAMEASAIILLTMMTAIKEISDETMSMEEAKFGGLVLISGNSLMGAKYREMTGEPFPMDSYLLFPLFLKDRENVLRRMGIKKFDWIPPDTQETPYAFIFYRGDHCCKQIPRVDLDKHSETLADLVAVKLASMKEGRQLVDVFKQVTESMEDNA